MTNGKPFPAPERVNVIDPKHHALFRYGPTKCALILRDMVDSYDKYVGGRTAHVAFGRALAKVDEMLDLVTRHYVETNAKRRKNMLNENYIGGFKEHLVTMRMLDATDQLFDFPSKMVEMFLAVAREKISNRKVALGINAPKSGIDYRPHDLIGWNESEMVKAARLRFRIFLSREDATTYRPNYSHLRY